MERDLCVLSRVRTTLGREETTLGASTSCWVYVYEYGSSGRRSEVDRTMYEKKKLKIGTQTTVLLHSHCCSTQHTRPGVPCEGQHRVETAVRFARGEVSFCVALGRSYTISIRREASCRFILWGTTLQQLYTARCLYVTEHRTDTG